MLCFSRSFASAIWRRTSKFSNDCNSELLANKLTGPDSSAGKPGTATLFLIAFLFLNLFSFPLLAAGAPATPGSINASKGDFLDIVRITWADVAEETEYQVFRCTTMEVDSCGVNIAVLEANSVQYDDLEAISIGGKQYYRLKSCNSAGCSEFSAVVTGYTQLVFGDGYGDRAVEITSFTANGASQIILPLPPTDPVYLDWGTRGAESCEASSSPVLDGWNALMSISTYGPKSVQFPELAGSYDLGVTCYSATDQEVSRIVMVTVGEVPEAPTLSSAVEGDQSAELSFTPNGDGGSPITGYRGKCGSITMEGPESPITISGLTNGVEYTCSVVASNSLGDSQESNTLSATPRTIPEAPTLVSANAGDQSAELVFTPNGDGGSAITGYTAKCGAITTDGPESPITISGLTNGAEYTCSVIAKNDAGDSPESNMMSVTLATVPEAPTLDTAIAGDQSAELSFTPNGDGGSAITGYTATCGEFATSGPESPITVNGLTNGVEYTCSVVASNDLGDSPQSNTKLVTLPTVPEAPTLDAAIEGDQSAELSFTPNGDGGLPITGYTAKCGAVTMDGPVSPITVSGLTNGVEYSCSVVASNDRGDSPVSNEILVTPLAPVEVSITKFEISTNKDPQPVSCGDTQITFEWEATGADNCYGSWVEVEPHLGAQLFGSFDQRTGALHGSETVLFEDLALTSQFTLRCENETDEAIMEKSVLVDAPCMTTVNKTWSETFTRSWPGPASYTTAIRITGDKAYAVRFNTGAVLSKTSSSSPITIAGMQRGAQYSCSVVANNASGQSSPSNLQYFNPEESIPEAPTLISATAGDGSATLTFTAREDLFDIIGYQAKCGSETQTGSSSPITVTNLKNGTGYYCTVTARNDLGIGPASNELPVTAQAPSLFVASAKNKGGDTTFQASPGDPGTSATAPSAPTLESYDLGHLAAELTFTDDVADATSYTASCRISIAGGVGTIEYANTRGARLLAISRYPGDFQVAEECMDVQDVDGFLIWKTEDSDYTGAACELESNTTYYWNITFTDGVNSGTSRCADTPCQTYIRNVTPDYVN